MIENCRNKSVDARRHEQDVSFEEVSVEAKYSNTYAFVIREL